jgi:hypothetical protein
VCVNTVNQRPSLQISLVILLYTNAVRVMWSNRYTHVIRERFVSLFFNLLFKLTALMNFDSVISTVFPEINLTLKLTWMFKKYTHHGRSYSSLSHIQVCMHGKIPVPKVHKWETSRRVSFDFLSNVPSHMLRQLWWPLSSLILHLNYIVIPVLI